MTRRKGRYVIVAAMVAVLLVLTGCVGGAPTFPQGRPCAGGTLFLPTWVHDAELLAGYYVGVGQADPEDDNFFLQKMRAREMALVDLLDQVQVTVESSLELMETQAREASGDLSAVRLAKRRLRVASSLTFHEVTAAGSYVDPSTCRLWVRYKIRRDIADNLIDLKQARALYQMTFDEKEATPAQKLRWITDALVRLNDVDFTVLPKGAGNENHLTALFVKRKTELEKRGTQTTVWVLSASPALRASLAPCLSRLAETRGAILIDVPCRTARECIGHAREYGGETLARIKADGKISEGALGMQKGALRIDVTRFDVATGALVSTRAEAGQTFAFDSEDMAWDDLAEELLAKLMRR